MKSPRSSRSVPLRSLVDVLADDAAWRPAPMEPIRPTTHATRRAGASGSISDIARRVRRDIASAVRAGKLPVGLKARVVVHAGSTPSLAVHAVLPPWMRAWRKTTAEDVEARTLGYPEAYTPQARTVAQRLGYLVDRYRTDDSDPVAHRFGDVNFRQTIYLDGERAEQELEILQAQREGHAPIDLTLTRAIGARLRLGDDRLAVFATEPGRRWTVAVWAEPVPLYARHREARRARRMDADSPEKALDAARGLARSLGLVKR